MPDRSGSGPAATPAARARTVIVNGRFLSQRITGVQRYAREVLTALDALRMEEPEQFGDLQFRLVAPPNAVLDLALTSISIERVGPINGNLWEQAILPAVAGDSLVLNLGNAAPLRVRNQAVTIHDAAVWCVPDAYSWRFRTWYQMLLSRVAARAACVFTVTRAAAHDLRKYVLPPGVEPVITGGGAEQILRVAADPTIVARAGLTGRRFVLAIASRNPAKNLRLVLETLKLPAFADVGLVLVGGANARVFGREDLRAGEGAKVTELRGVSDAELRALLEAADVMVSASRYEGFGLPLVEALACGCPVVASGIPAHHEVLGGAALLIDRLDRDHFAAGLRRVLDDAGLQETLRERGRVRAQQWGWRQAARQVWVALRGAVPGGAHSPARSPV